MSERKTIVKKEDKTKGIIDQTLTDLENVTLQLELSNIGQSQRDYDLITKEILLKEHAIQENLLVIKNVQLMNNLCQNKITELKLDLKKQTDLIKKSTNQKNEYRDFLSKKYKINEKNWGWDQETGMIITT